MSDHGNEAAFAFTTAHWAITGRAWAWAAAAADTHNTITAATTNRITVASTSRFPTIIVAIEAFTNNEQQCRRAAGRALAGRALLGWRREEYSPAGHSLCREIRR